MGEVLPILGLAGAGAAGAGGLTSVLSSLGIPAGVATPLATGLKTTMALYGIGQALRPTQDPFTQAGGLLTALDMLYGGEGLRGAAEKQGVRAPQYDVPIPRRPDWLERVLRAYRELYGSFYSPLRL